MDACISTITNQSDADRLSPYCSDIHISGAVGTLTIRNRTAIGNLVVDDSPELEILNFPQVLSMDAMAISHADSLTTVSLPRFSGGTIEYIANGSFSGTGVPFSLNITSAPKLTYLQAPIYYSNLVLNNITPYSGIGTNVTAAIRIQNNACISLPQLQDVGELQITGRLGGAFCDYSLDLLRSIGNLTILNASDVSGTIFNNINGFPSIQVNDSLIMEPSISPDPRVFGDEIGFSRISTVGNNLEISSLSSHSIIFDRLTGVGGSISLSNNTNCSFNFNQVSHATRIDMLDNEETLLPLFPELKTVGNIHLRGNIDTSGGPNIFPSLAFVPGTVTIEAWNDDFNCSKLVSQWNDGIIHDLFCNGTANGTVTSTPTPTPTPTPSTTATPGTNISNSLSPGALAGIGVSVGAVVLLGTVAIVWLVLHYKHRLKSLEKAQLPASPFNRQESPGDVLQTDVSGTHEVDGAGIIREKPDDHIIGEVPDDHIVELPVGDVDQSSSHKASWSSS
ncbi:hypothetical protein F5Y12DRAFT_717298 [Xylaria sp. FL1777]|nr:hypothetical protein F5Y12DRAFT_717298 [Xylaria sp. FL1777]